MEIDPTEIRRLRELHAWSQERLAEIAGLSVRTVQRIERGGGASLETRMALAAAFEVAPAALCHVAPEEARAISETRPSNRGPYTLRARRGLDARRYRAAMVLAAVLIVFGLFLLFGYLVGRDIALKERRQACIEQGRTDCAV